MAEPALSPLDTAIKYFQDVKTGLEVNKSLQYNLSVDTLSAALEVWDAPEVLEFLDEYLYKMIHILTSQSPAKLGTFERGCVENSIFNALKLLLKLLPKYPKYLAVASRIFDPSIIFYNGSKTGYVFTPGFPLIRLQMAKQFASAKGFEAILECLKHKDFIWTKSSDISNIIKTMNNRDVTTLVPLHVQKEIMAVVMSKVYGLTDEQMKKGNTDHLSDLLGHLSETANEISRNGGDAEAANGFHRFWFDNTMKVMSSGSLVLRLYAWEQMSALIDEALSSRPVASTYIVEGAGTPFVNGTYSLHRTGSNSDPEAAIDWTVTQYVKESTGQGVPTLLLFRCPMRTSASKWWFISHADLDAPGTEKDVDYYLHKSTANVEDQKEPPGRNWTRFTPGISLQGAEPAPTIRRGDIVYPKGSSEENCLDLKLLAWCVEKDILSRSYSPEYSPHREILSRTSKFLAFMSNYDALSRDNFRMVWKTAITCQSNDVREEIFTQLIILSVSLKPEMFHFLMDLAVESLRIEDNYVKVCLFIEKYAIEGKKFIDNAFPEALAARLLSLIWEAYMHPLFESLKNSSIISDLLSTCFKQTGGSSMVLQRMTECQKSLSTADDVCASQLTKVMTFLLSKHGSAELSKKLEGNGFSSSIILETKRLIGMYRKGKTSKNAEQSLLSELGSRLSLLRYFFCYSAEVHVLPSHLDELWALLSPDPAQLEQLFLFLKSCVTEAMGSMNNVLTIYLKFMCAKTIDWSTCGNNAFECFSTFFCELGKSSTFLPVDTVLPPRLGLDTLWDIALHISTEQAAKKSIELLLRSYNAIAVKDPKAHEELLSIVFRHLSEAAACKMTGPSIDATAALQVRVDRCVEVLNLANTQSKGLASAPSAHIVRGVMARIHISLFHRRVSHYYNQMTRMDVYRNDKGSEGVLKLDVHPYHTFGFLKERLCAIAKGTGGLSPNPASITVDSVSGNRGKAMLAVADISDSTRLMDLGVVDGSELSMAYQLNTSTAYSSSVVGPRRNYNARDDYYGDSSSVIAGGSSAIIAPPPGIPPAENSATGLTMPIGQILAGDASLFECLINLCQISKSASVTQKIWQLLMSLPSQADMLCLVEKAASTTSVDWGKVLGEHGTELARTAYLMQIVDSFLQPAPELNGSALEALDFKAGFIAGGGFAATLRILTELDTSSNDVITSTVSAVALHILHFLLFGADMESTSSPQGAGDETKGEALVRSSSNSTSAALLRQPELWAQLERHAGVVSEKLLFIAGSASDKEETGVVHNALMLVTALIRSPGIAKELTSKSQSKTILTTVLRSASKQVRLLAGEFATQVGMSQPVVFNWLMDELRIMTPDDESCSEIFASTSNLLRAASAVTNRTVDCGTLAELISDKLMSYPRDKLPEQAERYSLLGYLEVLEILLTLAAGDVLKTALGSDLVNVFTNDFLFAMPHDDVDCSSICDTAATRQAAFNVLSAYLRISKKGFEGVVDTLFTLSGMAARHMHSSWGLQVSSDVKRADISFTGLKNQGCTCYMNSLLQQLFMNVAFREAVLNTEIPESIRSTLWHRNDAELVGTTLLFEWADGSWKKGEVVAYDSSANVHRIVYRKTVEDRIAPVDAEAAEADEVAIFNIYKGRFRYETGQVKVMPLEGEDAVSEREEAAYRVLEQLQRTFCFMKLSKRRYFDPRPFVDACKTLNLNFNVYHQNDAAEFCDQLLDRLETAMKGKHSHKNSWDDALQRNVFGGKWMYEKIPTDCDEYEKEKSGCGHFQGSRQESYLKVELQIRGKEKIADSLSDLIQGELMDGDNKIQCDVCCQKKSAIRRSCFGALPSTLMLHLKRFDLDFTTFETVKLNNRMAFPTRINLLKYTKEGIEADERAKEALATAAAAAAAPGADEGEEMPGSPDGKVLRNNSDEGAATPRGKIQYENPVIDAAGNVINPEDYEYELQGVLVHAGVAQGGHYYSFAKDLNSTTEDGSGGRWFRFDDEDVSTFTEDEIPVSCFGGPMSAHVAAGTAGASGALHTNANHMDDDRTSNALMLFYNKVKPSRVAADADAAAVAEKLAHAIVSEEGEKKVAKPMSRLVSGTKAFQREVRESNLQHILSCYLLEPDLHSFVRGLISSIATKAQTSGAAADAIGDSEPLLWSPGSSSESRDVPLATVQFGITFLLDVVLHCRERAAMRSSVQVLKDAFEAFPHTAAWFLAKVLSVNGPCSWLSDFLVHCTDATARATFAQVLAQAAAVVAPKDVQALLPYVDSKVADLRAEIVSGNSAALLTILVRRITELVRKASINIRNADEIFLLVRDLSSIPCVCQALHELDVVAMLCYFVMPQNVSPAIRQLFESKYAQQTNTRFEFAAVLHSVFDALAALLGVPQLRQAALLTESSYWDADLIPEAKEALTLVFKESCNKQNLMDSHDLGLYFEKVTGTKMMPLQIRTQVLDRFHTTSEGKLTLDGFLQYHTDLASYNPKHVWRDLYVFGFINDLSRPSNSPAASVSPSTSSTTLTLEATAVGGTAASPEAPPDPNGPCLSPSHPAAGRAPLHNLLSEDSFQCLASITFYESGLPAADACTKAIAKRVFVGDERLSSVLLQQALFKLLSLTADSTWTSAPIGTILDILRLVIGLDDDLRLRRVQDLLLSENGIATIVHNERQRPSRCRANEYNKTGLLERYIGYAQDLVSTPGFVRAVTELAIRDPLVKYLKGGLRLRPGSNLTEREDKIVRGTTVVLSGAGAPEVNGEYKFVAVKHGAGYYGRIGTYQGKPARFTLYKCNLKNGGYQWFLSHTPGDFEPGTVQDVDFYYAQGKLADKLPPIQWFRMNNQRDPAPRVQLIRAPDSDEQVDEIQSGSSSSDSEPEPSSSPMVNVVNMGNHGIYNDHDLDTEGDGMDYYHA